MIHFSPASKRALDSVAGFRVANGRGVFVLGEVLGGQKMRPWGQVVQDGVATPVGTTEKAVAFNPRVHFIDPCQPALAELLTLYRNEEETDSVHLAKCEQWSGTCMLVNSTGTYLISLGAMSCGGCTHDLASHVRS